MKLESPDEGREHSAPVLRELRKSDAEEVAQLFRVAFGDSRPLDAEEIVSWFRNPELKSEWLRVLEHDGRIVGYGDISIEDDELALDLAAPGHWQTFFVWAEEEARAAGARKVRVFTPAGHELEHLLEREGYRLWRSSYTMEAKLSDVPSEAAFTSHRGSSCALTNLVTPNSSGWSPMKSSARTRSTMRSRHRAIREFYLRARGFDPSLWLLAWDGAELVGFVLAFA